MTCDSGFVTEQRQGESTSIANEKNIEFKFTTTVINGVRKFQCKFCSKISKEKNRLRMHFEDKHLNIKYPCTRCDYTTGDRKVLSKHEKFKHDKIKRHECGFCGYRCFAKADLRRHIECRHIESLSISEGELSIENMLLSINEFPVKKESDV